MNNKKLRLPILIVAILIVAILIIVANKSEDTQIAEGNNIESENTVIETGELAKTKTYKGIEISNVTIEIDEDRTRVKADLYNTTNSTIEKQWMNINILDKDGNRITSLAGYIDELEPGASSPLSSSIATKTEDKDAYDIEITEKVETVATEDVE